MSNARFSILQARAVKDKRITDSQFRTLAALGMYADENGWCFPSLTTLGVDLGKSKQAVGRDTIALRKLGYLEVTGRYDKKTGARHSNLYRLKFDLPRQPVVDAPSTSEVDTPSTVLVDPPSTDSVDAPSTSEVDVNDPINPPSNDTLNDPVNPPSFQKRGDLVDGYILYMNSPGLKAEARRDAILSYLAVKLNVNTETKRWKDFAKFVDGRQQDGQKVEVFISWLLAQKNFDIQFWPPSKMQEMWPQAFTAGTRANPEARKDYTGGQYADYIEH